MTMTAQERIDRRRAESLAAFEELIDIIERLRSENGCPWDRKQTHASLKPYVEEEAYEVIDAIDSGFPEHLCEELGDLLLQIMLHSQIAFENDEFSIASVIRGLSGKMIVRHPHVFADVQADTPEAVLTNWEKIKAKEKPDAGLFDGIPRHLPGLSRASRMGSRAARTGFDWKAVGDVRLKVQEELGELDEAIAGGDAEAVEHEIGDLLFAVAQWGRHLGQNPENALRKACSRFGDRYGQMAETVQSGGRTVADCSLEELEAVWQEVKKR
jgi:tetrapyrrole methylase family protein/MazG family protein